MNNKIKLQIHDIFGNIIEETLINFDSDNDILICKIHREPEDVSVDVIKAICNNIENALSGRSKYIIIPDFISFQVLKKEE